MNNKGTEQTKKPRRLIEQTNDETLIIPEDNILFIQADRSYCRVHYAQKEETDYLSKSLKEVETKLNEDDFFRVHKSYLVNVNYIDKIIYPENKLQLTNGQYISISRDKKKMLKQKLQYTGNEGPNK